MSQRQWPRNTNRRNYDFSKLINLLISTGFDENCTLYSKELLVNKLNGIINSDKFGRSYDEFYFGITFFGHSVYEPTKKYTMSTKK